MHYECMCFVCFLPQKTIVTSILIQRSNKIIGAGTPQLLRHIMCSSSAKNLTLLTRLLLICLILLVSNNITYVDEVVAYYWKHVLLSSPFFCHDSFEVVLSSLLFAVCTASWLILDFYVPAARNFSITDRTASNKSWKGRESALLQETLWYMIPWILFDIAVPRRHILLAQYARPPTSLRIVQDVCLSLICYDLLFFFGHLVMHKNKYLYRTIHSKHHYMGESLNQLLACVYFKSHTSPQILILLILACLITQVQILEPAMLFGIQCLMVSSM